MTPTQISIDSNIVLATWVCKLCIVNKSGVDLENEILMHNFQFLLKMGYTFFFAQPNFYMHRAKVTCICACKIPLNRALISTTLVNCIGHYGVLFSPIEDAFKQNL